MSQVRNTARPAGLPREAQKRHWTRLRETVEGPPAEFTPPRLVHLLIVTCNVAGISVFFFLSPDFFIF